MQQQGTGPIPPIDYTSRDYVSFRNDLLASAPLHMPEWTATSAGDFGVTLIELFSYIGDVLSYYGDRIANEAYLPTAVQRSSVLKLAALIDYTPAGNSAAAVALTVGIKANSGPTILPVRSQFATPATATDAAIIFEAVDTYTFPANATNATVYYTMDQNAKIITVQQGPSIQAEAIGTSTGGADQEFALLQSPVIDGSTQVFVDEGTGVPTQWTYFGHLTDAAPSDTAFTISTDENGIVHVRFGDGVNGRIPNPQATITANYRVGGDSGGNVGANTITVVLSHQPNIDVVNNPSPAQGGAEAETLDHIRAQAPKSLTAVNRAVTLGDYAALAIKVPSVGKARATANVFTAVNLYIHPSGGFLPDSSSIQTRAAVLADRLTNSGGTGYLDDKKMIGTTVTVLPPQYQGSPGYVPVFLIIQVYVLPQFSQDTVSQGVLSALNSLLSFDNVDFGYHLTVSSVYHALQSISGVDYIVLTDMRRNEVAATSPVAPQDVVCDANEIPQIGTVQIVPHGGLS